MSLSVNNPPKIDENSVFEREMQQRLAEEVHPCACCGAIAIFTPLILCSHCGQSLDIKCYIYQRGDKYYGECLTLNLISRGETQSEAIKRLQVAMFTYVDSAFAEGKSVKGLIPRRAPLSSWFRYYLHILQRKLTRLVGGQYPLATASTPSPNSAQYTVAEC